MRNNYLQVIFFGVGTILHLINLYVDIKVLWYIGCVFIIISPFLPGGFWSINWKKSSKGQEEKENSMQGTKNGTSYIEKDPEQENLPPS